MLRVLEIRPMPQWAVGLLLAGASLAMIFFTYIVCKTIFQMEEVLPRWAKQHGFRIIHKEARTFFQGPFFLHRYRPVYYIIVEDRQQKQKKGWIRLGWWYIIGFREFIEVRWED